MVLGIAERMEEWDLALDCIGFNHLHPCTCGPHNSADALRNHAALGAVVERRTRAVAERQSPSLESSHQVYPEIASPRPSRCQGGGSPCCP
jgi:hypothetical protein